MADIELNKPLYKADKDADFVPPIPRQPRPGFLMRCAALFLDIMLLHLVFGALARFAPQISLSLGWAAPWLGLLLGYLYFAIGFSRITLGRTLGKLILRVQVCDIQGPDLPVGRAFIRAAALLWPLPVLLILHMIAEANLNKEPLTAWAALDAVGTTLLIGWVLGNLAFTGLEPYNRSIHDRLAKSVIINAEIEAEPVAEYLAAVRSNVAPPRGISMLALGASVALCLAYGVVSLSSFSKELTALQDTASADRDSLLIDDFGRPIPGSATWDKESTGTLHVTFHYRKRTPIEVNSLKSNPQTTASLERIIADRTSEESAKAFRDNLMEGNSQRARSGQPPADIPQKLTFNVSFVEQADFFFARESHPVYTLSKTIDLPETFTKELGTTSTVTVATDSVSSGTTAGAAETTAGL